MRILFLTHYFPPEVNAPANRTFEHCREWVKAGHEVHVITCVPSHPKGKPFKGYQPGWYQQEDMEGIHVHRVWTILSPNRGVVRRALNYLSFIPTGVWRAMRLGEADILVATSPQFFCAVAGWLAASLKGIPWVFELRDLWPESIHAVGAMRASLPLRLLERLELRLYRSARGVVCVTRSFIENLSGRGIDASKLVFIPNGILPGKPCDIDGKAVLDEVGIPRDNIVASYVGTVGMAHGLGTLLEAAKHLKETEPRVHILIIGDGAELPELMDRAKKEGLTNVTFTGLMRHDKAAACLAASDIALVLLKKLPLFLTVLPSKMFEAMAAGKPVILGVGGEAKSVLERSGGGLAVEPEDGQALADALAALARDPGTRAALGARGRTFVELEFNREIWARQYLEHLQVWTKASPHLMGTT